MDAIPLRVLVLAAGLVALLLVALGAWLARWWSGVRSGARNRVARAGEAEAEKILADHGYEVVGRQVSARWCIEVDGERVEVGVRADLVVARQGRRYVAEVKTGDRAPDPRLPATRRQLLEYSFVFGAAQVLLVDVAARSVLCVRFPATRGG